MSKLQDLQEQIDNANSKLSIQEKSRQGLQAELEKCQIDLEGVILCILGCQNFFKSFYLELEVTVSFPMDLVCKLRRATGEKAPHSREKRRGI